MNGRLILVRHGESEGNAERRFTHSPEVPLTALGRAQALRAARAILERFAPVRLVSSPFRRAVQTAEIIGRELALAHDIEADVREQHLGDLHGQPYDAVTGADGYGIVSRHEWRPPGHEGESLLDVQRRAAPVIERLAAGFPAEHVVVVSHGGTTQAVWAWIEGSWGAIDSVPNCSLLVVPHDGQRFGEPQLLAAPDAPDR